MHLLRSFAALAGIAVFSASLAGAQSLTVIRPRPMLAEFTGIPAGTALNAADLQPVINASAKYQTIAKPFPASELIFAGAAR